jgi:hypothetical protein
MWPLRQIVADELDVSYRKVKIVMGNSATSLNQGGASSALGIQARCQTASQCIGRGAPHFAQSWHLKN